VRPAGWPTEVTICGGEVRMSPPVARWEPPPGPPADTAVGAGVG
jgi:hypothetical protein